MFLSDERVQVEVLVYRAHSSGICSNMSEQRHLLQVTTFERKLHDSRARSHHARGKQPRRTYHINLTYRMQLATIRRKMSSDASF